MSADGAEQLRQETVDLARVLDVRVRSVSIRKMTRKWASISTGGNLSLSTDVPLLPAELRKYVIVHELLHVQVPNHGPLWKALMHAHLGDYETLHAELQSFRRER